VQCPRNNWRFGFLCSAAPCGIARLDLFQGLTAAGEFGLNGFDRGGPDEGLGVFVPRVEELGDANSRSATLPNRVESILNPETLLPEHLTFRRREGKKNEDMEYTFYQKEGTVIEVKGGSTETLPILPHTQDAISCLYYAQRVNANARVVPDDECAS
jgi:hypothetical protein